MSYHWHDDEYGWCPCDEDLCTEDCPEDCMADHRGEE